MKTNLRDGRCPNILNMNVLCILYVIHIYIVIFYLLSFIIFLTQKKTADKKKISQHTFRSCVCLKFEQCSISIYTCGWYQGCLWKNSIPMGFFFGFHLSRKLLKHPTTKIFIQQKDLKSDKKMSAGLTWFHFHEITPENKFWPYLILKMK